MRTLWTIWWDIIRQWRYGFYGVTGILVVFWFALFKLIPDPSVVNQGLVVPGFLSFNLVITTLYFMAGLVLMEKDEGTLHALVATPLRHGEYLGSKVLTLTFLALLENVLILLPMFGLPTRWPLLLAGVILLSVLFVLIGFVSVARYDAINSFLLPSVVLIVVLTLPLLDHFGLWSNPVFYLHPVQPMLVLMRAGYQIVPGGMLAYGWMASLVWIALAAVWAHRRFARFVVRTAGS